MDIYQSAPYLNFYSRLAVDLDLDAYKFIYTSSSIYVRMGGKNNGEPIVWGRQKTNNRVLKWGTMGLMTFDKGLPWNTMVYWMEVCDSGLYQD